MKNFHKQNPNNHYSDDLKTKRLFLNYLNNWVRCTGESSPKLQIACIGRLSTDFQKKFFFAGMPPHKKRSKRTTVQI